MKWSLNPLKKEIDIEGFYTFFYREYTKEGHFGGERHNFWEILYVDFGELYIIADDNGYVLKQGDIVFHKPMEYHAFAASQNMPFKILVTSFETQSPAMEFFYGKSFSLSPEQKKMLSLFTEKMQNGFNGAHSSADYQIAAAQLEGLFLSLLHGKETSDANITLESFDGTFSHIVKLYLKSNVNSALALDEICKKFSVSKSYLCRIFKNETGKSIIDYFIDLKIREAKRLIREGELNFTQIAEALCYNDIHGFSRAFKNKTGLSPLAYKKSIK